MQGNHLGISEAGIFFRSDAFSVAQLNQLEFGMYPQSMPTEWTHARTLRPWQSVRLDFRDGKEPSFIGFGSVRVL